jgi:hypothetical protein
VVFGGGVTAAEYVEPRQLALATLEEKFYTDQHTAGYLKDGPGRFVQFYGITDEEMRALELREVSGLVTEFVQLVRAEALMGLLPVAHAASGPSLF